MNIALAIVVDSDRTRTLIAQRAPGSHLGGKWEFPGGKIEPDETAEECAAREALEETGLAVAVLAAWPPISWSYPDLAVTLHPFLCVADPSDAVADRWLWMPIDSLDAQAFPEANSALIATLQSLARSRSAEIGPGSSLGARESVGRAELRGNAQSENRTRP